ncbi:DUF5723 family protein [Flavobacterium sp. ASW18X]|uniref:DUF5723 family protein n=1 Tax=Flavobacterium sp. ASW18X TaxID=2572595 RepID=UPI0010AE952A|nr:DUF5723 family protein [Flavobacterium sp. ASW18X]TKD61901.1 hypothetical protein FBT53_11015 [Flavobacterium sp. ASW18X]
MRKLLVLLFVAFGLISISAQNKQLLYDFNEIPQSLLLNPGTKPSFKWHVGVPVLSAFNLQAGSSGVTVNDLFANDGIDFTAKVRERVINSMTERDEFSLSGQLELFNAGFRSRNNPDIYYSFGMYGEGYLSQFWPKDLAILAFEGNANNLNRQFNFSDLTTQGEVVNVLHFGVNKQLDQDWTVGARAKLYSSVLEFKSKGNTGYFETTQGQDNILRNSVVANVELKTSGLQEFLDIIDEDTGTTQVDLMNRFVSRSLFGGNLGIGVDLGFTKSLGANSYFTASLLDLGFVYHSNAVKNYQVVGSASNEGLEIRLPDDLANFNDQLWQELIDDLEEQVDYSTNQASWLSLRPIKLYSSFRYNFGEQSTGGGRTRRDNCGCAYNVGGGSANDQQVGDYKNAVGGQLFVINRPKGSQAALTAFYQRRLGNFLALKTTYTVDKYSLSNIGLGLNFQAGPVNFYVLGDNLLAYSNIADSHYASFQFGFNILSWNSN